MKYFIDDILLEYNALHRRVKITQAKIVRVVCRYYDALVQITLVQITKT